METEGRALQLPKTMLFCAGAGIHRRGGYAIWLWGTSSVEFAERLACRPRWGRVLPVFPKSRLAASAKQDPGTDSL
jgi:hypothetical protein